MFRSVATNQRSCCSNLILLLVLIHLNACDKQPRPTKAESPNSTTGNSVVSARGQESKADGDRRRGNGTKSEEPISVSANVRQRWEMGWGSSGGGRSYEMTVEVMNGTNSDLLMDELQFEFHRSDYDNVVSRMGVVTGLRVLFTAGGRMLTVFDYGGSDDEKGRPSTTNEYPPESQRVPANRGIRIPSISTGNMLVGMAGRAPTMVSLALLHKDTRVSEQFLAVLPPWDAIRDDADGFRMAFCERSDTLTPSGVTSRKLVDEICSTATRECDDARLERVTAELWLTYVNSQGKLG